MIESFPLCWPANWKRTPAHLRQPSRFRLSLDDVRKNLHYEIDMLGAVRLIISTNMPLRRDGEFYAGAKPPDDPGVAVYFIYKKKEMCFASDLHPMVRENLNAIAKTINALRGIERWGASDMMERAFTGFAALPAASWHTTLELDRNATREQVEAAFRRLAMLHHPDRGGDTARMAEINKAREEALKEIMNSKL